MQQKPMTISTLPKSEIIHYLDIPYYSQRDNRTQPDRTCNSTAVFTALQGIKPGLWDSDCDYIEHLHRYYGDTTNHSAHTNMLWDKGVKSSFHYDLDFHHLSLQLKKGHPIVIGILHRGWYKNPTGGHMICVVGEYRNGFICHDPYGYPSGGNYDPTRKGANVLFCHESLKYRWLADGPRSGWGRIFHG